MSVDSRDCFVLMTKSFGWTYTLSAHSGVNAKIKFWSSFISALSSKKDISKEWCYISTNKTIVRLRLMIFLDLFKRKNEFLDFLSHTTDHFIKRPHNAWAWTWECLSSFFVWKHFLDQSITKKQQRIHILHVHIIHSIDVNGQDMRQCYLNGILSTYLWLTNCTWQSTFSL